jgi:hypothetical protein
MITVEGGRQDFSVAKPILVTLLWASQPMNRGSVCGRDKKFMFSPRLCGSPSILSNWYWRFFPHEQSGLEVKPNTHLRLLPRWDFFASSLPVGNLHVHQRTYDWNNGEWIELVGMNVLEIFLICYLDRTAVLFEVLGKYLSVINAKLFFCGTATVQGVICIFKIAVKWYELFFCEILYTNHMALKFI